MYECNIHMNIHPLWSVCLLVRLSMAFIVLNYKSLDKLMLVILSLIGISFLYRGYTGSNNEVQVAPVFWHDTRYAHGIFYLLAALYLFIGNSTIASIILASDVVFSILYRIITSK